MNQPLDVDDTESVDDPTDVAPKKRARPRSAEVRDLHNRLGLTIVYVTHDQEEALALSSRVVLMQAGRIEQIDSARDICTRPVSRFAAEFVGDSNLIKGVVGHSASGGLQLETTLGTLPVPQDRGFARGAPVLVLIRPEHLITDPVALDQSAITLEAEVTRIAYAGPTSQVKLAVATQDLLIRRINTPGQQDLMLSDWLHIGLANATFRPHLIVLAGSDPTSKSRSAPLSTSGRAEA